MQFCALSRAVAFAVPCLLLVLVLVPVLVWCPGPRAKSAMRKKTQVLYTAITKRTRAPIKVPRSGVAVM